MAAILVASSSIFGINGGVTPTIDTTGANLLVVSISWYSGSGGSTISAIADSKGNSWIPLTLRDAGDVSHQLYYVLSPTVGSGHYATMAVANSYSVITFWAFSGISSYQVESGATTVVAGPLASGSVTPSSNGALIISGWTGMNTPSSPSISGFTLTTNQPDVLGQCVDGAAGYLIQTTAAAINPTWSWTGTNHVAVGTAVFLPTVVIPTVTEKIQFFICMV